MELCGHHEKLLVDAGRLLLKKKLVARTWGNVSVRVDDLHFCITPTGAYYESIEPEDIVRVDLQTLQTWGKRKPSSELLLHAKIYQHFPKLSFILHTHQKWASLLALFCYSKRGCIRVEGRDSHLLASVLPSAEYAEAGTEKIAQNLLDAIVACSEELSSASFGKETSLADGESKSGIAFMAHHGVVIFAQDIEEAFNLAQEVEDYAKSFVLNKLGVLGIEEGACLVDVGDGLILLDDSMRNIENVADKDFFDTKISLFATAFRDIVSKNSCEDGSFAKGKSSVMFFFSCKISSTLSCLLSCLSNLEYEPNLKVWKIGKNRDGERTDGQCIKGIGAYFDDVAQIAGSFFRIVSVEQLGDNWNNDVELKSFLSGEDCILVIKGQGVILLAPSREEACNILTLFEKNTYAFLLSLIDKKIKPLPIDVARRLRIGYATSYSKRAEEAH